MIEYSLPPELEEIQFEDGGTWYRHDGRYLTSVGKILDSVYPMPPFIAPWYLTRGKMVHDATALIDRGTLDWQDLDPRLAPFCQAYQIFRDSTRPIILASELIVVAADYSHGGRLDRVYQFPDRERPVVADIKVGSGRGERYWLQVAAYALLLGGEGVGDYDHAIVNLGKDGRPRLSMAPDPAGNVAKWRQLLADYFGGECAPVHDSGDGEE